MQSHQTLVLVSIVYHHDDVTASHERERQPCAFAGGCGGVWSTRCVRSFINPDPGWPGRPPPSVQQRPSTTRLASLTWLARTAAK